MEVSPKMLHNSSSKLHHSHFNRMKLVANAEEEIFILELIFLSFSH